MRRHLPDDSLVSLENRGTGLDSTQVQSQQLRYGPNLIVAAVSSSWIKLLRDTLRDPMVWFLVLTAILFAVVGDYFEAGVLAAALLPILGMDAYLHRRTQISTAALAQRLSTTVCVLREGQDRRILATDLVPGDIVTLKANEFVPADALFISGEGLQVDESALSGEAMPVRKSVLTQLLPAAGNRLIDPKNLAYAGTRLLTGSAKVVVAWTGKTTVYGEIVRLAQASMHQRTPLQQAMMSLTNVLLVTALVFCLLLGAVRIAQGHGWLDAVIGSITLAIAVLPEEFPVVFTFFLGVGVYRLAQQQALVRRAVVVENIGRVTCICSDKTGTLTEGQLVLAHKAVASGVSEQRLLRAAAIASRHESEDPLDGALLAATERPDLQVVATFPFSEDRRRETAIVKCSDQVWLACVKGAPETVLTMCALDIKDQQAWTKRAHEFASTGHKVIGFAERTMSGVDPQVTEPTQGYTFLGLIAFEDPVRQGAKDAVNAALAAGIRVIMVTGDHPATATAIARELGLGAPGEPIVGNGDELNKLAMKDIDVLARATPAQKLKLVQTLRQQGEIVAVTGDGVNDAPALKGADIGIAMGEHGTQAAREVASIVLLDDNFRTIVRAIAEGRQLFANLQLSFAYLLMVHFPLVMTAAWIPLAGYPLLYLPVHIVWLELIIHPTALLCFQQKTASQALAKMRSTRTATGFFDWRQWSMILLVAVLITAAMIIAYEHSLIGNSDVMHARSIALSILIASSTAVTIGLSALRTRAAWIVAVTSLLVFLFAIQSQLGLRVLQLSSLHSVDWVVVLLAAAVVGVIAALFPRLQLRKRSG